MVVECVQCVLKNARSYIRLISEIVLAYEGESNIEFEGLILHLHILFIPYYQISLLPSILTVKPMIVQNEDACM